MLVFALAACPNPSDPEQHTITFNSQGGSGVGPITADTGAEVAKPADPTRDGYTFQGWFDAASGGTAIVWPHTLTGDVTMHARWQETLPALTGTVSIEGTAKVGEVLTANTGSLGGTGAISYQWGRGDTAAGSFVNINGATSSSYTLAAADLGKHVRVTASRAGNSGTASSNATAKVSMDINITIGFNYGDISIAGDDGTNTIYKGSAAPASLTLSAEGYNDAQWHVDGSDSPAGTGNSITLEASAYSAKAHSITFTGKRDGKLYSQIIPFTVRN
jgi:uncharacterized repeat protein (TIGR02543 family)